LILVSNVSLLSKVAWLVNSQNHTTLLNKLTSETKITTFEFVRTESKQNSPGLKPKKVQLHMLKSYLNKK